MKYSFMRKIIVLLTACFIMKMQSSALAAQVEIVAVQLDKPSYGIEAFMLNNEEIWVTGRCVDSNDSWIAQVDLDGRIVEFYELDLVASKVVLCGERRYVLAYDYTVTSMIRTVFIELLGSGEMGAPVCLDIASASIMPAFSGILVYNPIKSEPWLTFLDENLEVKMVVEQPVKYMMHFAELDYSPTIMNAYESADTLTLLGWASEGLYYRMRIDHLGTVLAYTEISSSYGKDGLPMFMDALYGTDEFTIFCGNIMSSINHGKAFIQKRTAEDIITLEKIIYRGEGMVTIKNVYPTEDGFLLFGNKTLDTEHGTEETLYIILVSQTGEVISEQEIDSFDVYGNNGFVLDGKFILFGDGKGEQFGKAVYVVIDLDDY